MGFLHGFHRLISPLALLALFACQTLDFKAQTLDAKHAGGSSAPPLSVKWYAGDDKCAAPHEPFQIYQLDPSTIIMRQNICLPGKEAYAAPFLYLLFGQDNVLMLDTGSTAPEVNHIAEVVEAQIRRYLTTAGKSSIKLIVAHTHGHSDHIAGDGAFVHRPNTIVAGVGPDNVAAFWGFSSMTGASITRDLGKRVLDVMPIPGHFRDHIAIYDRQTGILFSGDSLYPGHLFVEAGQWPVYKSSIRRLADFVADKNVTYVLGSHIEIGAVAGALFPYDSRTHPANEHALELFKRHLDELNKALSKQDQPHCDKHDAFSVEPQELGC